MTYTNFERDLLKWFIDHSTHTALTAQLQAATLQSREYTGAGIYLNFVVPADAKRLPADLASPINGPRISAPSLTDGAGCLLFHEHGYVAFIEVYTYTDAVFADIEDHRLHDA